MLLERGPIERIWTGEPEQCSKTNALFLFRFLFLFKKKWLAERPELGG